ncbi:WD40-repeat-containing domain protein [Infundibulicybe gibba]|nr:WD40-repeat-containing domain protein [Infundibulicybe gibba]
MAEGVQKAKRDGIKIKKAKLDKPITPALPKPKGSLRPTKLKAASKPIPNTIHAKGKAKEIDGALALESNIALTTAADPLPSSFKVVAGSYEKLLYGLHGTVTVDADSKLDFNLKPIFIFPAHVSCIKAVAASPNGGKWLATGSADEIVKVWDLRRKKEIGGLMHHEGSITHLTFPSRSHLLSASEDGTLCLFRARDWAVLRSLKGHKGRVNSVAVHPSGKLALSVGKDKALRMWDLMRGKGCASTKLRKEAEVVRWSTDGSMFAVQAASTIDIYNTDMVLIHTINHPSRLHDVRFCKRPQADGEVLLAGAEDKKLTIYDVSNDPEKIPIIIAYMIGHSNRVKAVQTLEIALPNFFPNHKTTTIVCTVSSDGKIHIYDMAALSPSPTNNSIDEITPVAEYDSKGTRLTCVTLADGDVDELIVPAGGKRKRPSNESDEEDLIEGGGNDDAWEDEWGGVEEAEQESDEVVI